MLRLPALAQETLTVSDDMVLNDCPLVFPHHDKTSQCLQQKFLEVSAMDLGARPYLPRVSIMKSTAGVIAEQVSCECPI